MTNITIEVKEYELYIKNIIQGEPPEVIAITKEQADFIFNKKREKQSIRLPDGSVINHIDVLRIEKVKNPQDRPWINIKNENIHVRYDTCTNFFIFFKNEKCKITEEILEEFKNKKIINSWYVFHFGNQKFLISKKTNQIFKEFNKKIIPIGEKANIQTSSPGLFGQKSKEILNKKIKQTELLKNYYETE